MIALNSAKVLSCHRIIKKANQRKNHQSLALLNSFFLAFLYYTQLCRSKTSTPKNKKFHKCQNLSSLGTIEQLLVSALLYSLKSAEVELCCRKNLIMFNIADNHQNLAMLSSVFSALLYIPSTLLKIHFSRRQFWLCCTTPQQQ